MNTTCKSLFLHISAPVIFFLFSCEVPKNELTDKEVVEFAKRVESFANARDMKSLNETFDKEAFGQKMNLPATQNAKDYIAGINQKLELGTLLFQQSKNIQYEYLHHYIKEGVHHLIFRFAGKNEGLNYHDFEVGRYKKDQCRFTDMFLYTTGENYSETVRNLFYETGLDPDAYKDIVIFKENDLYRLQRLRYYMQQKDYPAAKNEFDQLSLTAQQLRFIQIQHILICSRISNDEQVKAIESFKKLFPDEKRLGLLFLDGYFINEDYNKALECINQIDSAVMGDPYLHFYRYNIYTRMNEKDKALKSLEVSVAQTKNFEDAILQLISEYLARNENLKADPLVKRFRAGKKFNQEQLDLLLQSYPSYVEKAK